MNGPGPRKTSSSPVLVNAPASVVRLPASTAVSTMSFEGGRRIVSMTWLTPFDALTSANTTLLVPVLDTGRCG